MRALCTLLFALALQGGLFCRHSQAAQTAGFGGFITAAITGAPYSPAAHSGVISISYGDGVTRSAAVKVGW